MVVKGNAMWEKLNQELNFGFKRIGSLVLAFSPKDLKVLDQLMENGIKNGETSLRMVDQNELRNMEPEVSREAILR